MLFNTTTFAIFFLVVFAMYWMVARKSLLLRNIFLWVASYVFYAWWDWRYLFLIFASTLIGFLAGKLIESQKRKLTRKWILWLGVGLVLGSLVFFKYYNFFVSSFIDAFSGLGIHLSIHTLSIILPVGISFYTFMIIGYIIDVYKARVPAEKNVVTYFAFISFFPQLLAGPIGRAKSLLPQFNTKAVFDYDSAKDGIRQILWGLFKKVVIADSCAVYVNSVFQNYETLPASSVIIGAFYYAIQIYADFSGYSDMAIGTARLLGINLMKNFHFPYFSRDISDFWKRWHISLSTWFRDYLFLPIAYAIDRKIKSPRVIGIKAETWSYAAGIFITWFLVGLWHGANRNFILWGLIHGIALIIFNISRKTRNKILRFLHIGEKSIGWVLLQGFLTFIIVLVAFVFFRANDASHAFHFIGNMFKEGLFSVPTNVGSKLYILIFSFLTIEWLQRHREHALQVENIKWPVVRWGFYYLILFMVFIYMGKEQSFIYFQF